jgi:hypothetical protein
MKYSQVILDTLLSRKVDPPTDAKSAKVVLLPLIRRIF